jgi:hypothetical protein
VNSIAGITRNHPHDFQKRPKKELPIGTTRSIIRQSGLTPQEFGF